jgi:predicted PurR-regulated permease PerM
MPPDNPIRPQTFIATAPARVVPRVSPHSPLADFARRVVVAVLLTVLLLTLVYLMWRGARVLLEAFAGVLFGLFLFTLAEWLQKHTRLSYGRALAVVVVGLILAACGVGWLFASRVSAQLGELMHKLPESLQAVRDYLAESSWGHYLIEKMPTTPDSAAELAGVKGAASFVTGMAGVLVTAAVILFVGGFGAAEPDQYKRGLFLLVPPRHRARVGEAVDALVFNLRWWLMGQVFLMLVLWGTTTVALMLMGIPLALVLGLITGLFELIPYAGAWISAVPATLIALLISPGHVVGVLALYLCLHVLEGYILVPLIQRRTVGLPPALTLVSQVLLGEMMGVLGLFVAAPLTVCAIVLLKMLYIEDTLGDQTVEVPGEPAGEAKPNGAAQGRA